jgi:hypothetical protein
MRKEDVALFLEIKKMKPLEVQEGLRIFRQIRAEQIKLDNQYGTPPPPPHKKDTSATFHNDIARMSIKNRG